MKIHEYSPLGAVESPRRVEERAQSQLLDPTSPQSDAGQQQRIVELEVRLAELELQNQRLHDSAEHYKNLYDAAPVAYLTLARSGAITRANIAAGELLGDSPFDLAGQALVSFVAESDRDAFHSFLKQTFGTPTRQVLEVAMVSRLELVRTVRIDATSTLDGQECRIVLQDVSERKFAEESLRESAERLRLAVQASNIGIMDWDLRTDQIVFSREWSTLLGNSLDEIGNEFSEWKRRIHPDDLAPMANRLQIYLACPEAGYEVEFRMRHKDGSWRWMYARGEVLRDGQGTPIRVLGCHVDITARKAVETALRTSQELNNAILDHFPGLVSAKDMLGNFIMVNRRFEVLDGPEPEAFLGKNVVELFPKEVADSFWESNLQAQRTGRPVQSEEQIRHKDGTLHTYVTTKLPLYKNNVMFGTCAISFDITDVKLAEASLRRSEEKYRSIFENAVEGMFRTTPDGRFLELNPSLARIFGYASPGEVIRNHSHIGELLFVDSERRLDFKRQMESIGSVTGFEFQIYRKDGSTAWVRENARAERDAAGVIRHYEGTIEDITERRQAEETLRQANVRLTVLSRSMIEIQESERRHLARELHDEIGQVLTAVFYNLSALKSLWDPVAKPRLEDSLTIVDHAIQQVRTMSLDLRPSMLDDLGLAATVKWYANRLADRTGLMIHVDAPPSGVNLPAEVKIACFRVAQEAMTNIVRHARAHEVWIELVQAEEEVRLVIRDNGDGFDLNVARTRAVHGRSVGLLGMQERVELIGGEFTMESSPGKGTSIYLRFGLHQLAEYQVTNSARGAK